MKDRASNETTPTQQIYETELLNMAKSSTVSMEELVQAIPTYTRVRHTLRRKRIKTRAVLPTSITAIQLTTLLQQIVRPIADSATDLSFLIYQGKNNNILVFCSKIGLEILSKSPRHFILRLSIAINFI